MHAACHYGHFKIVEIFIQNSNKLNIHFDTKTIHNETVFHLACERGNLKIVEMLMQKSAELNIDLNAKTGIMGNTAFHLACHHGQLKIVELLIQNSDKVDLTARDSFGQSGFTIAVRVGKISMINLIRKKNTKNCLWLIVIFL